MLPNASLRSKYPRTNAAIVIACLAAIGLIWFAAYERAKFELAETIAHEFEQNATLAIALEEHAISTLRGAEQAARFVRDEYLSRGRAMDIARYLRRDAPDAALLTVASVIDEQGNVVLSNLPAGAVNYADRDFFKYHLQRRRDEFYIDQPVLGRLSGQWRIPMSLRLEKPDGTFDGVVALAIDPDYFAAFYRKANIGSHGLLTLVGLDGIARVRQVGGTSTYGLDMPESTMLAAQARNPIGSLEAAGKTDGVVRLYSYRTLKQYPLIVGVGTARDEALASVRERGRVYYTGAAAASAIILVFAAGLILARTRQRREEALSALEHSVAKCLADAEDESGALREVIGALCSAGDWDCGRYCSVDEKAGLMRQRASWGVAEPAIQEFLEAAKSVVYQRGAGLAGQVWQSGEPMWTRNSSNDSRVQVMALAREYGIQGAFLFPVKSQGGTVGVVTLSARKYREPDEGMLAAVAVIGAQIGQFLRRKEAEAVLRSSEERFRCLTSLSSDWYWEQDKNFRFTLMSGGAAKSGLVDVSIAMGKTRWELPIELSETEWAAHRATLEAHRPFTDFEYKVRDVDGNARFFSARGEPLFDAGGHFLGYRGTANDISARVQSEVATRRFRAAMDTTSDAIYLTDRTHMRFFDVNETACRMQGATRAELLARGPAGVLTQSIEELAHTYDGIIAGGGTEPLELLRTRKDGTQVWVELRRRALQTSDGWMIITVARDITERKQMEARLLQQANFDSLTQLPNRLLCYDRLSQALIQAKRKKATAALLFVDLDRFKQVNDTLGHAIGDRLLQEVSLRLTACVRAGDTVGRLGGDEFVIVLPEVAQAKDAARIAQKAIDALALPFELEKHALSISASIGIATAPDQGDTVETLIRNADSAMFEAKQSGRNAYRFFAADAKVEALPEH